MLHLDQEDPEEDGERKLLKPRNMMKGNEGGDIAIVKVSNLIMLGKLLLYLETDSTILWKLSTYYCWLMNMYYVKV